MWRLVGQLPVKPGKWDAPLSLWDSSQSNKHGNHIIDSFTQIPIDSISYFLNFFNSIFNFFSTILNFFSANFNFFGTKLKFPRHWIKYFFLPLCITVENVLTLVRCKNYTEIYHSNVIERFVWYKTCDDTVAATYVFS